MRKTNECKVHTGLRVARHSCPDLCFVPNSGLAATDCTDDQDCDGIPDSVEKPSELVSLFSVVQKVLPCTRSPRRGQAPCLNWQTPDLFVILVRANGCPGTPPTCTGSNVPLGTCAPLFNGRKTNIPLKPYPQTICLLAMIHGSWWRRPRMQGGLGITIHEITASQVTLNEDTSLVPATSKRQ